ncbi:unnamed protein product [Trichobilharzia regenti]|nr:unnamed protein product [Trichobilharzia regenti]
MKVFSNHEILDLTEEEKLNSNVLQRNMLNNKPVMCTIHPECILTSFCLQCHACFDYEHKGHITILLELVPTHIDSLLSDMIDICRLKQKDFRDSVDVMHSLLSELSASRDTNKTVILETCKQWIAAIEKVKLSKQQAISDFSAKFLFTPGTASVYDVVRQQFGSFGFTDSLESSVQQITDTLLQAFPTPNSHISALSGVEDVANDLNQLTIKSDGLIDTDSLVCMDQGVSAQLAPVFGTPFITSDNLRPGNSIMPPLDVDPSLMLKQKLPANYSATLYEYSRIRSARCTQMNIRAKWGSLGCELGRLNSPHGFCLGFDEEIVVADTYNHRIQHGEFVSFFGVSGRVDGLMWYPRKVAIIRQSQRYVVCDRGNERSRMQLFSRSGHFVRRIPIRYIDIVAGLAINQHGTLFLFANTFQAHCVIVFQEDGTFIRRIGGESITDFPNGIDVSDHGDVLVGDSHGNRFHIAVFSRTGELLSEFVCNQTKVSRSCCLKITTEGYVVTLARSSNNVLVMQTLYIC